MRDHATNLHMYIAITHHLIQEHMCKTSVY